MENTGLLIGVSGKARSGKDTTGEFLVEEFKEYGTVKAAFADELKRQVAEHFNLSHEQLYGDMKEVPDERFPKYGVRPYCAGLGKDKLDERYWTPREIMQEYGQFMRSIDYNYWVKALFKQLKTKGIHSVVITDCRHQNEVDFVVNKGGYHVRVYRDNMDVIHNSNHISETALDSCKVIDYKVINNYSLEELKLTAGELADLIKEDQRNGIKKERSYN